MNAGLDSTQLALLAHELRGALTVIRGLNDLLRSGLPPAQQASALESIDRAVARADALVSSALAGETTPRVTGSERVDLVMLTRGVVEEQRAITGRDVLFEAASTATVHGDQNALSRVLTNLIDNALKYSLAKHPVEVSLRIEDASAVIDVADRGPGIPDECRDAVFEPFERLGRDDGIPGSGLGLTVVRSVTEAHHGSAMTLPREGGGTIVRLLLPLACS